MRSPEYLQANGFIAEVIRTQRVKSVDIRVEEGTVSIIVPDQLPVDRITKLLKDKDRWIREKISLQHEALPTSCKQYISGESFSYLGRNYRLKVIDGPFAPVKLIEGRLVAALPSSQEQPHMIRNALIRWYRHHAEIKLKAKAQRYSSIVGVIPKSIGVRAFKSRWGSCSPAGQIDFNWKIIMAPNRIVDYVVIHELCHLIQHDHSPLFWKEVERAMPDYAECKEWLKMNAVKLDI